MPKSLPDQNSPRTPRRIDGYIPIAEYAVVGNKRSGAVIASDGAVDWLCLPAFDSPAVFGALLDSDAGGRWTLQPSEPFQVSRRYVDDTNVLETTFVTESGTLCVRDAMARGATRPIDWDELVRSVECVDGEVTFRWRVEPRFDFKTHEAESIEPHEEASVAESGGSAFTIRYETLALTLSVWDCGEPSIRDGGIDGERTLKKGETAVLVLGSFDDRPLAFSERAEVERRVDDTLVLWKGWSDGVLYDGPWRDLVVRSALALELMVCEPDKSMIAAFTSSLPERIGGDKNWDYRYAWVRDTTFAMDSLLRVGFPDSVHGMLTWLLHTTRRTHPRVHTFYGLDGRVHDQADVLPWSGYRGSTPVRVGNDAGGQLQLGNFGDILQTSWLYVRAGNRLDPASARQLAEVADLLCDLWRNEDSCIWELEDARHYTQSKMSAWLCFHRALQLAEGGHIPADHAARWRAEADALREFIDTQCFDRERGVWKRWTDEYALDAAVLLIAGMDYVEPDDPRLHATIDAVRDELGAGGGLLYRYTGVDQEEGCFLACSFWLVEALARVDRVDEAVEIMEQLAALANDVNLYSEMYDAERREMLGNFPQALTHLSLISAAFAIERHR